MGRYYYGSIEGKFWFGVQYSSAADRFGVNGVTLNDGWLGYNFSTEHLPSITQELSNIESNLGDKLNNLIIFFREHPNGDNKLLCKELGINSLDELIYVLREYADYLMGCQIKDCVESHGECWFTAEP
jgi:hypothetical protein